MIPTNQTDSTTTGPVLTTHQSLPPDQISPKAVMLKVFKLKNVFKRNWKLMLIIIALGAGIGFLYDLSEPTRVTYTGTIKFNLGGTSSGGSFGGELGQLAGAFGLGSGAPDASIFSGDNFLIYAQSRPVVEKTLMKNDTINGKDTLLVNYYIRHSGIQDKEWEDNDSLRTFYFDGPKKPGEYTRQERVAMGDIYTRISGEISVTEPERKSSFMLLSAFMEDEQLTATFLTSHLKTIEQDYQTKQTKKTSEMLKVLDFRADSIAGLLSGTENKLARYIDQNQQVVVAQAKIQENRLTRNSSFLTSIYYQAVQSAENMRLSLIRETPLFNIIEPVYLPLFREELKSKGVQIGIGIAILLAIIAVFFRETYRSIMREG